MRTTIYRGALLCGAFLFMVAERCLGADLFQYAREAPMDLCIAGEKKRGGVTIQDLSFGDGRDGRIAAFLVKPGVAGPHPGMLFVHWLNGLSRDSNRTEFLEEAIGLAESGAESLLVDAMWARERWFKW